MRVGGLLSFIAAVASAPANAATVFPPAAGLKDAVVLKGNVGMLGEWALSGTLDATKTASSGPMILRHIGLCSADGPDEKAGRISATLRDGTADALTLDLGSDRCVYVGPLRLKPAVTRGTMRCGGGHVIPLSIWVATDH